MSKGFGTLPFRKVAVQIKVGDKVRYSFGTLPFRKVAVLRRSGLQGQHAVLEPYHFVRSQYKRTHVRLADVGFGTLPFRKVAVQ